MGKVCQAPLQSTEGQKFEYLHNKEFETACIIPHYSGPKGARVKVSPPFFVFMLGVLNFLRGYKA